jgi:hypothetical protein
MLKRNLQATAASFFRHREADEKFKTHRWALDFDKGFVNVFLKEKNTGAA